MPKETTKPVLNDQMDCFPNRYDDADLRTDPLDESECLSFSGRESFDDREPTRRRSKRTYERIDGASGSRRHRVGFVRPSTVHQSLRRPKNPGIRSKDPRPSQ